MKPTPIKKVVLAYSGGLDTSVILKWLQETYHAEIIAFCADLGQGEDLQAIKAKAKKLGVKKVYVEDLRETFVKDYVFPMAVLCELWMLILLASRKNCIT